MIIRHRYDLPLVVQTETIAFFLGNIMKFSSAILVFGSRSMVALVIGKLFLAVCTLF